MHQIAVISKSRRRRRPLLWKFISHFASGISERSNFKKGKCIIHEIGYRCRVYNYLREDFERRSDMRIFYSKGILWMRLVSFIANKKSPFPNYKSWHIANSWSNVTLLPGGGCSAARIGKSMKKWSIETLRTDTRRCQKSWVVCKWWMRD